jgi:cobalt-zinc-cadmium efflux system membrane fusion protein
LAVLFGLAVWGHYNDWKVPSFSAHSGRDAPEADEPDSSPSKPPDASGTLPARVELRSADVARKAGIQDSPVKTREVSRYVTAHAMLDYEPGLISQLGSPVDGRIWRVEKGYGASVRQGDVLAVIDAAEVGKAKADFLLSLGQLDAATNKMEAMRAARSSVPEGDYRQAEAALRVARVRLFNDHQRLLNLGLPIRLEDVAKLSDEERVRFVRFLGLPESIRKEAASLETLTANFFPLKAPFDGVVLRHPRAARGEVVSARSQPLFVVADTRHLHIELEVKQEDVPLLRLAQEVTFIPETRGGRQAQGPLSHISPEVNEKTRHVLAHAEVDNPKGLLRPNTFGTGRILVAHKPRAVVVPTLAVQVLPAASGPEKGDVNVVFVRLSETTFEARPVQIGIQADGYTEVTGVRPGERVVTTGAFALKSELLKDRIGAEE